MTQRRDNLVVKRGILLGIALTFAVFLLSFHLLPNLNHEPGLLMRLKIGVKSLVFPALFFLLMIIRIGTQRFGNPAEDPTRVLASSHAMQVDLRVLTNTHEQLILFMINAMALAILLPFTCLTLLPIYSAIFVIGRILFWAGYRHNVLWRAPGFGMTLLPALIGLLYSAIALLITSV